MITPDMLISEVLQIDTGLVPIFFESGMHCLGCPSAAGESIKDACSVHGIDADELVKKLNKYLEEKQQ